VQQLVDNRYRLLKPLGSGGMADVFLAHDDILDRDVALKVMSTRYKGDEEFVERFKREAQSAAALSHPNIVSIFDRGESEDGTYYIAMEYLPGGTLKDRILKRGALPAYTAAAVALQMAEALRAAHERDVIHRDIKPHNILVTGSGDVKVTDFGIARAASAATISVTNAVFVTVGYISPEQALGEPVSPRTELYILGVILYEMLTGERSPKSLNPVIPKDLNALVVKFLAKDPANRPGRESATDDAIFSTWSVCYGRSAGWPSWASDTNSLTSSCRTSWTIPGASPANWRRDPWCWSFIAAIGAHTATGSWSAMPGITESSRGAGRR
jgi:serine/threonine-protein kinase